MRVNVTIYAEYDLPEGWEIAPDASNVIKFGNYYGEFDVVPIISSQPAESYKKVFCFSYPHDLSDEVEKAITYMRVEMTQGSDDAP